VGQRQQERKMETQIKQAEKRVERSVQDLQDDLDQFERIRQERRQRDAERAARERGKMSEEKRAEFLTASQAAERLGTSLTNVARWCREGMLLAKKLGVGNAWQIPVEALDGFTPPPRGPKPAKDRKRLFEQAQQLITDYPLLTDSAIVGNELVDYAAVLARQAGCTRARARQALAKAVRLARYEAIRTHLPRPTSRRTLAELARPDDDAPGPDEEIVQIN
jgi:excisionase family DNA binding protein